MRRGLRLPACALVAVLIAGCAPAAPPAPTAAPAKPAAPAAAPASPQPAAPAAPAASPAAKPSPSSSPSPAASPAAAAAVKPAAQPSFDEQAVASFYRGKTVHIIVGTVAGGTFDRLARLAARFMPKYIPSNPNIIVENMESAGGRVSANHLYNAAPKDGTVLATFNPGLVNAQLMGEQGVQYDATKFNWVGSLQDNHMACYVNSPTGVKSLADIMGPNGKELKLGAQAPGSGGYDYMALMKELGAKIRIVSGYEGSGPIYLAMEQGELDGTCLTWEATSASRPDFFEGPNPKLNVFIQFGGEKVQALPTVPHISEFVKTDEQRALVNALSASEQIQRPLALPPGVPTDRVLALRKAFNDLVQDPELLAEVKRTNDALAPKTGEQVEQVVTSIMNTPKPLVDELKRVIQAR